MKEIWSIITSPLELVNIYFTSDKDLQAVISQQQYESAYQLGIGRLVTLPGGSSWEVHLMTSSVLLLHCALATTAVIQTML